MEQSVIDESIVACFPLRMHRAIELAQPVCGVDLLHLQFCFTLVIIAALNVIKEGSSAVGKDGRAACIA